jgi:hypothetical protein
MKETNIMVDVLDSSIRVFQTAFPSVMQYLGNAKDREAKAAREEEKKNSRGPGLN